MSTRILCPVILLFFTSVFISCTSDPEGDGVGNDDTQSGDTSSDTSEEVTSDADIDGEEDAPEDGTDDADDTDDTGDTDDTDDTDGIEHRDIVSDADQGGAVDLDGDTDLGNDTDLDDVNDLAWDSEGDLGGDADLVVDTDVVADPDATDGLTYDTDIDSALDPDTTGDADSTADVDVDLGTGDTGVHDTFDFDADFDADESSDPDASTAYITVTGTVIEELTGDPIANATVSIYEGGDSDISGEDGSYSIQVPVYSYLRIIAQADGYIGDVEGVGTRDVDLTNQIIDLLPPAYLDAAFESVGLVRDNVKGHLIADFTTTSSGGGETAFPSLAYDAVAGVDADGAFILTSSVIEDADRVMLFFANMTLGTASAYATALEGWICEEYESDLLWPVIVNTITHVDFYCSEI